ncbi:MAG TPA: cyanophycin synthetase [Candidatus Limnocylindrales bacterium]
MTRDAASIGAGLAPARPARPIRPDERIHVVGAAGAGASAGALLARYAGATVSGCDPGGASPYTPALEAAGIVLTWRHDPAHVTRNPSPDRLGVTKALTAVRPDHPELIAAVERGIPVEPWQQVVADAATGRRLVAVTGTHGKSTTAGWLTHVLVGAERDPSAFVGALMPTSITGGPPATARWGRGPEFVVEADEYAGNFDPFSPSVVAVTSVEWDHPDVFADRAAVIDALEAWLRRAADPTVIVNVTDAGGGELAARVTDLGTRLVRVGVDGAAGSSSPAYAAETLATGPVRTRIRLSGRGIDPFEVDLPTAGAHNVGNALVVAATAVELGVPDAGIAAGLRTFPGVGRRLERIGEASGVVVYDDYGHHPTAIRATLEAIRQREPGRRVWAVYEPLTYHRTAAMLGAFADVLADADGVVIADIWAGRDRDTRVTSAGRLANAVAKRRPSIPIAAPGSVDATAAWLAGEVRDGDAVLVMGGGHSYRIPRLLLEAIERR